MSSSKDYDRTPNVAVQPTVQFKTWDTTDDGNVMNINGNVTMGKPRTRSSRAEKYGGQAPRSVSSQPVPVGNDQRGYSSRQPSGRSQGLSTSQNNVYTALQQPQNVESPHRVQSAPPAQNTPQSRFSRSATSPLSYNPLNTDQLSHHPPPPAAVPPTQYSRLSSNQPSSPPTYPSYHPPNTQDLPYTPPPAAVPTTRYSRQTLSQPSSLSMPPSYIPPHTLELPSAAPPPTAQHSRQPSNQPSPSPNASAYRPEPNTAFRNQQVSLPSTASSASMGGQALSMGRASQTAASSQFSVTGAGAQELTLLGIEEYLQKANKTSRSDLAAYLRAEEDYVKHILSKMASPTGNSFEKSQRSYASKVSKSVPKICARLFVYQLARIFFDGKTDPRAIPFCDRQLQDWGKLDMTACLEEEGDIEEAIKIGYKSELQNEDTVDKITDLDTRASKLRKKLARSTGTAA